MSLTIITSKDLAKLFIDHVWKYYNFPESCISDRDSLFISDWWRYFCRRLKVTYKFSTVYHPETDGQTEIVNVYIKQYLRMFIFYYQDNWLIRSRWLNSLITISFPHRSQLRRFSLILVNIYVLILNFLNLIIKKF